MFEVNARETALLSPLITALMNGLTAPLSGSAGDDTGAAADPVFDDGGRDAFESRRGGGAGVGGAEVGKAVVSAAAGCCFGRTVALSVTAATGGVTRADCGDSLLSHSNAPPTTMMSPAVAPAATRTAGARCLAIGMVGCIDNSAAEPITVGELRSVG